MPEKTACCHAFPHEEEKQTTQNDNDLGVLHFMAGYLDTPVQESNVTSHCYNRYSRRLLRMSPCVCVCVCVCACLFAC